MAPIRVALVGLSAKSLSKWGASVHLPYFLSPNGKKNYQITALLNTSVAAATAARKHFGLPQDVKPYGDPQALASDPDVDLVVCSTFVGHHFDTIAPSLQAGKRVFVEWPFTTTVSEALKLQSLVPSPDIWERSIIGLQGRASAPAEKLKSLLEQGSIGKVLSSRVEASADLLSVSAGTIPEPAAFFVDKAKGANGISIGYGHFIDTVHAVLGEWESSQARTQIQRPDIKLLGADPTPKRTTSDVPDLVAVHGTVKGKEYVAEGASVVVSWQSGKQFKGTPALVWTINGERGAIQLVSQASPFLGAHAYHGPVTIKIHHLATDETEDVTWEWEDWQSDLSATGRSTATLYDRYAAWVQQGEKEISKGKEWPNLGDALLRMREIEELLSGSSR
ncbi:Oxidoreductase [Lasiodiplodia theobromae]|uniref:Oxidoreductase n=1 Tax=Lasiodiplodia theobromae TaxID=45133 RepID=UPI0015C3C85D|nr:Oxidoreductase [Lasiodiplodia theobromae]KAF4546185.1 Oxidoreductase [Lasiodiplodia theobromae]